MKKFYYARYSSFGVKTIWGDTGNPTGISLAFTSKASRDNWVDDHEWDYYPNWSACTETRENVEQALGKFIIVNDKRCADGALSVYKYKGDYGNLKKIKNCLYCSVKKARAWMI